MFTFCSGNPNVTPFLTAFEKFNGLYSVHQWFKSVGWGSGFEGLRWGPRFSKVLLFNAKSDPHHCLKFLRNRYLFFPDHFSLRPALDEILLCEEGGSAVQLQIPLWTEEWAGDEKLPRPVRLFAWRPGSSRDSRPGRCCGHTSAGWGPPALARSVPGMHCSSVVPVPSVRLYRSRISGYW
jgi:hypothetical protein